MSRRVDARDLAFGAGAVGAATLASALLEPLVSESDIIMIFVLAVSVAAHRLRLAGSLATALGAVLAFNFFFTAPRFTLFVHDTRYVLTFVVLGVTGGVISSLAARARDREGQSRDLYLLGRALASCGAPEEVAAVLSEHLGRMLGAPVTVWLKDGAALVAQSPASPADTADARRAAELPRSVRGAGGAWFHPLRREDRVRGVLGAGTPASDRHDLVVTVVDLASEVLDRLGLEANARDARLAAEAEQIRSTLLSSVSHDLRTPLATITGAATTLLDERARVEPALRRELLARITDEAARLERLLGNVLQMTRLGGERGVAPALDWHVPQEVVGAAIARISARAGGRGVTVSAAADPGLTRMDALLVEQAVANLLENALVHAPGGPIEVRVGCDDEQTTIEVADRGPGVADGEVEALFEKFARGRSAPPGGAGLGLAICRAVAQVHGGRAWGRPRAGGGAVFGLALPRGGPDRQIPPDPAELAATLEAS